VLAAALGNQGRFLFSGEIYADPFQTALQPEGKKVFAA
jgi:hypothetical protein